MEKNDIVKVHNVSKSYNSIPIFRNLNFSCKKGQIIGITGPNGSGKSVFFKLLSGLIQPSSGEITVFNENITTKNIIPPHIGALIEEPGFIENYSGFNNLKFLSSIKNIVNDEHIHTTLKLVGLENEESKKVKNYSLGMKKKLGIAQAIMEFPQLLLLDEPMNALDKDTVLNLMDVFKNLSNEGVTIIIVSHNDIDIQNLCKETYIINNNTLERV